MHDGITQPANNSVHLYLNDTKLIQEKHLIQKKTTTTKKNQPKWSRIIITMCLQK